MLEIKNVVNREIDGIPKKEYWIQMQLQMEVCQLNECDFLETKFIEYESRTDFMEDVSTDIYEDDDGHEFFNVCLSKDEKPKGQIIYFHTKEGKPLYIYKPLNVVHPEDIEKWYETTLEKYQSNEQYMYMKTIYWKLEHLSCVLVCRNEHWFQRNISSLEEIWNIIVQERTDGHAHRAPNRRVKPPLNQPTEINQCLIQRKINSIFTVHKLDTNNVYDEYEYDHEQL
jgi:hypothetical protein